MTSDTIRTPRDETDGAGTATRSTDRRDVLLGSKGGFIATVVMTAFRMPVSNALPPTAEFWARYVGGGEPEDYPLQAVALHLGYGMAAGAAFAWLFGTRDLESEVERERRGAVWGLAFGGLLSAFGTEIVLKRLLGMSDLTPDERWVFHVSHAVYGLTLGTWLGATEEPTDRRRRPASVDAPSRGPSDAARERR